MDTEKQNLMKIIKRMHTLVESDDIEIRSKYVYRTLACVCCVVSAV